MIQQHLFRALCVCAMLAAADVGKAQIVFSNNFEANTFGFTPGGSISSLSRNFLPTDSAGPGSLNRSNWLGPVGFGVPKSPFADEIARLNLSGLSAGDVYNIAFDLFIGASWDGSAIGLGSDIWQLKAGGKSLVNTTFSNGNQNQEYGAYSPQRYSDLTYTSLVGPDWGKFTGADESFTTYNPGGGCCNYNSHYAIYRFERGLGNPQLVFIASSNTALLEFSRTRISTGDSSDEY